MRQDVFMMGTVWRLAPRGFSVLAELSYFAGCSDDPYNEPLFPLILSYKSAQESVSIQRSNAGWWKAFDDPLHNTLVEIEPTGNLGVNIPRECASNGASVTRSGSSASSRKAYLIKSASFRSFLLATVKVLSCNNPPRGV